MENETVPPVWIGARGEIYRRLSIGRRGDGVFSLKVADWKELERLEVRRKRVETSSWWIGLLMGQ